MIRLLFFFLIVLPFQNYAQDVAAMLKEAQQLENAFNENGAYLKYAEILRSQPNNVFALVKSSELTNRIGHRQQDKTKRIDYFKASKKYAEAALKVDPNNSDANFVMSLAMGRIAQMAGGKEKIVAVTEIKRYAENAIRLDPNNFKAYHVMGKWNAEVSNLNSVERTLCKWFYGGIPYASLKNSISYYEKSRALNPQFVLNYLELAKVYMRNDQNKKAIESLNFMLTLPNNMLDDVQAKEEARKLLHELK